MKFSIDLSTPVLNKAFEPDDKYTMFIHTQNRDVAGDFNELMLPELWYIIPKEVFHKIPLGDSPIQSVKYSLSIKKRAGQHFPTTSSTLYLIYKIPTPVIFHYYKIKYQENCN